MRFPLPHGRDRTAALGRISLLVLLSWSLHGCKQQPPAPPATKGGSSPAPTSMPVPATQEIGVGRLQGDTYVHDYFGLSMRFPAGWQITVAPPSDTEGSAVFAGNDPELQRRVKEAAKFTLNLVSAFENAPGSGGTPNNITVAAEALRGKGDPKATVEYLKHLRATMQRSPMKFKFDEIETNHKLGSVPAACLPVHMDIGPTMRIFQRHYAAVLPTHVVTVTLSYADFDAREVMEGVLQTMKLGE